MLSGIRQHFHETIARSAEKVPYDGKARENNGYRVYTRENEGELYFEEARDKILGHEVQKIRLLVVDRPDSSEEIVRIIAGSVQEPRNKPKVWADGPPSELNIIQLGRVAWHLSNVASFIKRTSQK